MKYLELVDGLGLTLTPAQHEFARVAYDGEEPSGTTLESVKLWAFGDGVAAPAVARRVAAAVCGRGSGKSLMGGTRVLHLAMTVDVSKLAAREVAFCPVVAPDLDTAQQVVRFALGGAEKLGLRIEQRQHGGESAFTIVRSGGKRVRILARSASAGGKSIRGRSMPCAVLDEACFFRDKLYKVNDQDIFDALKPRIMPGGQLVILSSPWIESGLLYDLWTRNYGHPVDALVAHAPTSLMRSDDPVVLADIEAERAVDPQKTSRERDAEFMTANAATFFDARALAAMLTDKEPILIPGATKTCGGDFAFRRNSTSFSGAQLYEDTNGLKVFEITGLKERRPDGAPLKPSEICKEAADFCKDVKSDEMVSDGHYRETIVEELNKSDIAHVIAPEGALGKADVYQTTRRLVHEGSVKLAKTFKGDPVMSERLLRQLREITMRPLPGGGTAFDSPTWRTGEHGDIASAFMLSVWRLFKLGWTVPTKDVLKEAAAANIDPIERQLMDQAAAEQERRDRVNRATGMREPLKRGRF